MVFGIVVLFVFLVIGMLGLYLIQLQEASWVSVLGWGLFCVGVLLTIQTLRFVDRVYFSYPRELRRLVVFLFTTGLLIGVGASGLEAEFPLTPIRMTIATLGVCWAFSGIYLLLKRNVIL
ncbi:MAG: hypothetical protein LiPW39_515 [Parcubacteria group bacterium LiPW_39]|nr:MAG: hypothetical protein LiPW39_515 [Parcubacteria group bacterium LiPW_39]